MDANGLLGLLPATSSRAGTEGEDLVLQAAVSLFGSRNASRPIISGALDALSRERMAWPFYAHVLETTLQRVLGEEKFGGRSLVRYLADEGLLSDRLNIIHARMAG